MITTHIMISMLLILVAVLVPVIYFKKSKHISLVVFFFRRSWFLFIEPSS